MFEYSAPISVWFIAVGFNLLFQSVPKKRFVQKMKALFNAGIPAKGIAGIVVGVVIYISVTFTYASIRDVKVMLYNHPLYYLSGPANWLKNNTLSGSLVFNAGWDDWPFLFYFNDHNKYLVGLDPIFMYAYDAEKYALWHRIITGQVKQHLASTIINNFNSRYIVVSKRRKFKKFIGMLLDNPTITKTFEDSSGFVFAIEES